MDGLLMKKLTSHSLTVAAIVLATIGVRDVHSATLVVPPDPSTLEGKALVSAACSKCHGASGNGVSISPLFPVLAAQLPGYIEAELKLFRIRGRSDPRARAFMWGIARGLSDEQIKGVAQYFSSQPAVRGTPSSNPALADKGKAMYENGAPARDIRLALCATATVARESTPSHGSQASIETMLRQRCSSTAAACEKTR